MNEVMTGVSYLPKILEAPIREEASGTHEFKIILTDNNSTIEVDKYDYEVIVEEW